MKIRVWGLAAICAAVVCSSGLAADLPASGWLKFLNPKPQTQTPPEPTEQEKAAALAAMPKALDHLQMMLDRAAKEEDRERYQKVTIDALLYSALANQDQNGKPLVGRKFDVVGRLAIHTEPGVERYTLEGSNPWHPGILRLDKLSEEERAEIDDQCSPTPCAARLLVTVLPPIPHGPAMLEVDGFR